MHLQDILLTLPREIDALVALPEKPPPWVELGSIRVNPTPITNLGRLSWEQKTIPGLSNEMEAHLFHSTSGAGPLFRRTHTLVSPIQGPKNPGRGLIGKLRAAAALGGLARAEGFLWPDIFPENPALTREIRLPNFAHPGFKHANSTFPTHVPGHDLPATFILVDGLTQFEEYQMALEAWTWGAGPIGEVYPLLWVGLNANQKREIVPLIRRFQLEESVILAPDLTPDQLPQIYQRAAALFHPAEVSPWASAVHLALPSGLPVVGVELPYIGALAGPAALLTPAGDPRKLGAGLISVIVRDNIRDSLREAALERTANWAGIEWGERLAAVYREILLKPRMKIRPDA